MNKIPLFKGIPKLEELKEAIENKKPLFLGIPLATNYNYKVCQLACEYCFIEKKENTNQLKIEDHIRIIDEFSELGGKYIKTATVGEPFLDRKFYNHKGTIDDKNIGAENIVLKTKCISNILESKYPLIDYANNKGLHWTSFSNLVMITEEIARELYKKDFSIIGKLNSLKPDIMEDMTGNRGFFKEKNWTTYHNLKIPKYLKYLIDAGFNKSIEGHTKLAVDIVVTKKNYKDIPDVVIFCSENNIYPDIETLEVSGDAKINKNNLVLSYEENNWLYKELEKITGKKFLENDRIRTTNYCPIFTAGVAYNIDGSVRFCYNVDSGLDINLKDQNLIDAYHQMLEIKKDLKYSIDINYKKRKDILNPCPMGSYNG